MVRLHKEFQDLYEGENDANARKIDEMMRYAEDNLTSIKQAIEDSDADAMLNDEGST